MSDSLDRDDFTLFKILITKKFSSRFSCNIEVDTLELLDNLEEMFLCTTCIIMSLADSNFQPYIHFYNVV